VVECGGSHSGAFFFGGSLDGIFFWKKIWLAISPRHNQKVCEKYG